MSGVWLASYVVLWVVVLLLAFLLAGALRQLGLLQLRLGDDPGALITDTGLQRGAEAPDFTALGAESPTTGASSSRCSSRKERSRPAWGSFLWTASRH